MTSIEWIHLHAGSSVSSGSCSHTPLYIVSERTRIGRQPYLFCAFSDCVRLLSCHQTSNVLEITTLRCYERGYKLSTQRQKNVGNKIKGEKRSWRQFIGRSGYSRWRQPFCPRDNTASFAQWRDGWLGSPQNSLAPLPTASRFVTSFPFVLPLRFLLCFAQQPRAALYINMYVLKVL
jgi:hypothetical protein